jgi:hypothetical protein
VGINERVRNELVAFDFLVIDVLRVLQALIVILGVVIVYFASKSFRKTKSGAMLFLALGFVFVTVGAVAAGILFEFLLPGDLQAADAVSAVCEVVGFALIVYSIVGTRD